MPRSALENFIPRFDETPPQKNHAVSATGAPTGILAILREEQKMSLRKCALLAGGVFAALLVVSGPAMAAESVRNGGKVAIVAYDPMSPISGGALLGDRLRVDFNAVDENVFYRSLARVGEDYDTLPEILKLIGGAGFDHVIVETVGAGQNDVAIRTHVDETVVVLVPGMGDAVQMDKAGILEIADIFVVNKADYDGESALVRELLDIANGRTILETIATQGKGVVELLERLF